MVRELSFIRCQINRPAAFSFLQLLRVSFRGVPLGLGLRFWSGFWIWVRGGGGGGFWWCWGRARGWNRCRGNEAPSFVPLHVPHTSDGLDLRCSGSPSVPVLEVSMFENVLAASVAWIHVSHPPLKRWELIVELCILQMHLWILL